MNHTYNPAHPIGTCAACGGEMVFNVPRMGPNGGFVHKETGHLLCGSGARATIFLMKPPTVLELREIAQNHHAGSDFYEHQIKHSRLSHDELLNKQRMARKAKLVALACERWAADIDAKRPGS